MEKRITRSKKADVAVPTDFSARLPAVQRALYLLFNEGYHGASPTSAVHAELCHEAMRLAAVLRDHRLGATPASYALAALMCLNAARLPSRIDAAGNLNSLFDQDRSLWDRKRLSEGMRLLDLSASGVELSAYHIEAAMASVHAMALYDSLMLINPSPIVALNRAIAIAQRDGPEQGIGAIKTISNVDRLAGYPFYPAALGELELRRGNGKRAHKHFQSALAKARNPMERRFFQQRLAACALTNTESTTTAVYWEPNLANTEVGCSDDD